MNPYPIEDKNFIENINLNTNEFKNLKNSYSQKRISSSVFFKKRF